VDGAPEAIRLDGTSEQLLHGTALRFSSCSGTTVSLPKGRHELVAASPLQPDWVLLSTPGALESQPTVVPTIRPHARADGGYDVDASGASGPFFLTIGEDYSAGWRAFVGGKSLGPPMVLDGYSAGWLINRPGSYTIAIRYGPQLGYELLLLVSLLFLLGAAVAVCLGLRRRRRRYGSPRRGPRTATVAQPADTPGRPGLAGTLLLGLAFLGLAYLFGGRYGLVAAAVVLVARLVGTPRAVLWAVAVILMAGAPVAVMAQGLPSGPVVGTSFGADHVVAHVLVGLSLLVATFGALEESVRLASTRRKRFRHRAR
jgi:hypothetical protein